MIRSMNRIGFTLIELMIALSILILIGGVGSQVDFVDLLDKEKFLTERGIELNTPSLIAKLEGNTLKDDKFLIQVVCSVLGRREASDALQQLEGLINHEDYFVAKRAKMAIDQIRNTEVKQPTDVLVRIRKMLPENSTLAFDADADFKSNVENTKNLYRPAIQNETLLMIQSKIGNAQVDSLRVVALNEDRNSFLVLATGRFYQSKMSETLEQLSFKEVRSSDDEWVGSTENLGGTIQMALAQGRSLVAEISLGEPFVLDAKKLLVIAGELNKD